MAPEAPTVHPTTPSPSAASTTRAQSDVYMNSIPYLPKPSQTQTEYVPSAVSSQQTVASYDVQTPKASPSPRPAVQIMALSSQRVDMNAAQSIPPSQQNIGNPIFSETHTNGLVGARPTTPPQPDSEAQQHSYRSVNNDSSPSSGASGSPTHGSKRTASGTVKQHSPPLPSPAKVRGHIGHLRNISLDSNISRVSELSAQLKSRLSYAMVKVQHGWEKRSIDEVENLAASQLESPRSATSTNRNAFSPSRGATVNANRTSRDLSNITSNADIYRDCSSQRSQPTASALAFSNPNGTTSSGQAPPALAPAPDLRPTTNNSESASRRIHTAHTSKPSLPGVKTSNGHSQSPTRGTPTPQEQDAVDTLLFMSSPANSGHFPAHVSSSAQPSPLRSTFPRLTESGGRTSAGSDRVDGRAAKRRSLGLRNEADVERVLAQMGQEDAAGSDEEMDTPVQRRTAALDVGIR